MCSKSRKLDSRSCDASVVGKEREKRRRKRRKRTLAFQIDSLRAELLRRGLCCCCCCCCCCCVWGVLIFSRRPGGQVAMNRSNYTLCCITKPPSRGMLCCAHLLLLYGAVCLFSSELLHYSEQFKPQDDKWMFHLSSSTISICFQAVSQDSNCRTIVFSPLYNYKFILSLAKVEEWNAQANTTQSREKKKVVEKR